MSNWTQLVSLLGHCIYKEDLQGPGVSPAHTGHRNLLWWSETGNFLRGDGAEQWPWQQVMLAQKPEPLWKVKEMILLLKRQSSAATQRPFLNEDTKLPCMEATPAT